MNGLVGNEFQVEGRRHIPEVNRVLGLGMGEDLVARMVLVLNEVVEHDWVEWMESKMNQLFIIILRLLIIENCLLP